ncbi:hypothetical protein GBW32_13440 [Streptomyces tsukubensis]|nr:hypothetical protein GBW32_13440 [Streptomyces tsukubensis]
MTAPRTRRAAPVTPGGRAGPTKQLWPGRGKPHGGSHRAGRRRPGAEAEAEARAGAGDEAGAGAGDEAGAGAEAGDEAGAGAEAGVGAECHPSHSPATATARREAVRSETARSGGATTRAGAVRRLPTQDP